MATQLRNPLVFGAARLHHLATAAQRQKLLATALDIGIRSFDVAPAYGNGINEREIGIALRGKRDACEINTKFGIPVDEYAAWARHFFLPRKLLDAAFGTHKQAYLKRNFSGDEIERSIEKSLARLKTDYIDTLFVHEPVAQITQQQLSEIVESAERMKRKGKIRSLGIAGPRTSIGLCPSVEMFDTVQLPLLDFRRDDALTQKRQVILYGAYQAYKAVPDRLDFCGFVKASIASAAGARIIVSSKSIRTVNTFRELAYETS